jgi:hypothetical protein
MLETIIHLHHSCWLLTFCVKSVRTVGMCRVLVVPRSTFNIVAADFPLSVSALMNNLVAEAEEVSAFLGS